MALIPNPAGRIHPRDHRIEADERRSEISSITGKNRNPGSRISTGAGYSGKNGTMFRIRQTVGGKYRLNRRLAEGGFATVYHATDLVEGIPVALKVPHLQYQGPQALEEFRREGRVMARLEHPNILPVKNAMVTDGFLLIAYPLGEQSLSDRLERRLGLKTALGFAFQMLTAVAWAHSRGVMHLDIKPENFILFRDGRIRLTDFGVAHISWKTRKFDTLAGTPGYMAPEQAMGHPSMRSDVFSLGLVMYRMFGGVLPQWPFDWPPPRIERLERNLSPGLIRMLRRCLKPQARLRYADATDLFDVFEAEWKRMSPGQTGDRQGSCSWCRAGKED